MCRVQRGRRARLGEGGAARGLQTRAAEVEWTRGCDAWCAMRDAWQRLCCAQRPRFSSRGRRSKNRHLARPWPCLFTVYTAPSFSPLFGLAGFSEPAPPSHQTRDLSATIAPATNDHRVCRWKTLRSPPSASAPCMSACIIPSAVRLTAASIRLRQPVDFPWAHRVEHRRPSPCFNGQRSPSQHRHQCLARLVHT